MRAQENPAFGDGPKAGFIGGNRVLVVEQNAKQAKRRDCGKGRAVDNDDTIIDDTIFAPRLQRG
ncbi:hypothetical protein DT23_03730 [Thioclava indica]|uniref:Uncharacterized protein n=1 Tax=Thioclava indica TaxID=1353528 RepID=A0A074JUA4_9RHOB|nr:hypothetical protein DT23_03730 [Thioclava indica]